MVLLTPFSQGTHLLSVGRLIVVGDQAYHRCVISKFDDDIGAVCSCTVVCVQGVHRSGLRTQPCGAPVLRIRGDDVLFAHSDSYFHHIIKVLYRHVHTLIKRLPSCRTFRHILRQDTHTAVINRLTANKKASTLASSVCTYK